MLGHWAPSPQMQIFWKGEEELAKGKRERKTGGKEERKKERLSIDGLTGMQGAGMDKMISSGAKREKSQENGQRIQGWQAQSDDQKISHQNHEGEKTQIRNPATTQDRSEEKEKAQADRGHETWLMETVEQIKD